MPHFRQHNKHSAPRLHRHPQSPPPPYQTLPPTPTPYHASNSYAAYSTTNLTLSSPPQYGGQGPTSFSSHPPQPLPYQTQSVPATPNVYTYNPHQHVYYQSPPQASATLLPPQQKPWQSCVNLGAITQTLNDAGDLAYNLHGRIVGQNCSVQTWNGLIDAVSVKFNDVITSMDDETFSGQENDLVVTHSQPVLRGGDAHEHRQHREHHKPSRDKKSASATTRVVSGNHFSKVYQYANARMPADLPPLKLYFATWPLLCLAAQYSRRAYDNPSGAERHTHIDADWRRGTKAMVLKSVPLDDMNTIVFAIRGTQNFRDWATNMKTEPTAPRGFLDDPGNLCHAGFLSVARKMVRPVAARLHDLLRENPHRSSCSLIITGHSAGGAVAALLYSHMLAQTVQSELTYLRGFFKRVHCVTFGAPPVSLLPLQKPEGPAYAKSLFFAIVNEGDPVPRADRAYVLSLLELYARPAPDSPLNCSSTKIDRVPVAAGDRRWNVPVSTLSVAGRVVVLRTTTTTTTAVPPAGTRKRRSRSKDSPPPPLPPRGRTVEACVTTDTELRTVVFGDPMMHPMDLYAERIETLATKAVTARLTTK